MRISSLAVKDLFGIFDHKVPLNLRDRITIIHGPNGYGKTVLLKMLSALFDARYEELERIPFGSLEVQFTTDRKTLEVTREAKRTPKGKRNGGNEERLAIRLGERDSKTEPFFPLPKDERSFLWAAHFPLEPGRLQATLDADAEHELAHRLAPYFPSAAVRWSDATSGALLERQKEPEWLTDLRREIHVRFIETQRLLTVRSGERAAGTRPMPPAVTSVVDEDSHELAASIQSKLAESTTLAQKLDSTFPGRLLSHSGAPDVDDTLLQKRLNDLAGKRGHLITTGLLEPGEGTDVQVPAAVDPYTKGVLSLYLDDANQKLDVFEDMAARIDLLTRIVNERFRHKTLSISKLDGFVFRTDGGKTLPVGNLSSGEQHELVLLYELLFRVSPNSLILIDEPELSLHVAWQEAFLEDLEQVVQLRSFDVLIATHSPQIINGKWDLTVELKDAVARV